MSSERHGLAPVKPPQMSCLTGLLEWRRYIFKDLFHTDHVILLQHPHGQIHFMACRAFSARRVWYCAVRFSSSAFLFWSLAFCSFLRATSASLSARRCSPSASLAFCSAS